jgi:hypothetical protein
MTKNKISKIATFTDSFVVNDFFALQHGRNLKIIQPIRVSPRIPGTMALEK